MPPNGISSPSRWPARRSRAAEPPQARDSLEALVGEAVAAVSRMQKRTGYVIKREGRHLTIARGRSHGIKVGQRYRTTDTHEEFVISKVMEQTAEGDITGPAMAALPGANGRVDVVFVIDTTAACRRRSTAS